MKLGQQLIIDQCSELINDGDEVFCKDRNGSSPIGEPWVVPYHSLKMKDARKREVSAPRE